LDPTFGHDGKLTSSVGVGRNDVVRDVAVQGAGKIVAVGTGNNGDLALIRYNLNGTPDTSFGPGGRRTTDLSSDPDPDYDDVAHDVVLQHDGKIVVSGRSGYVAALARYNPNGTLDTTFDEDGKVLAPDVNSWDNGGLSLQSDGKLLAGNRGDDRAVVVRYDADGSRDTTFGEDKVANWPYYDPEGGDQKNVV